ncbi:MAG: serine hydrolase, partial [Desulfobacteraceae bacterium]|nr:serine hydrolase [Desulfobacteraceae bacterium]
MNNKVKILVVFVLSVFLTAKCVSISHGDYLYQIPAGINDGLKTESLYKTDIDFKRLIDLVQNIQNESYKNIHSLLIVKDDKLILEEYFHGFNREKAHQIRSANKSIGSILTGIAIDHHYIKNAEEKIYPYFKNYGTSPKWDKRVRDVSLKSLLTMTSGYACDDHIIPIFQCEKAMYKTNDWLKYALNLPMAYKPLEHFAYNSSSLMIVSEIISKTSKMTIPDFADTYLFKPLGINEFQWGFSPKKRVFIAGKAKMRPRDMVKIGLLMLNNGRWNNKQIISKKWVNISTKGHTISDNHRSYGYLWWIGSHLFGKEIIKGYWAAGNGGNYIFVCPRLNLVAVFTGGNYSTPLEIQPLGMLINYIIPSMLPPIEPRQTIKTDSKVLDSCIGEYQQQSGHMSISIFKKGENLFCNILEDTSQIYPVKKDHF